MAKDDSIVPSNETTPMVPALPNVPKYVSEISPVSNTVPDSIIDEESENIILSPQPGPSGLQQQQKNSEIISRDFPIQLDLSSDSEEDDDIQVVKISRKNGAKDNNSKKRSIEEVDLTAENDVVSLTFDNRVLSNSIFTRDISQENSNDSTSAVAQPPSSAVQNSKGLLETTSCVLCLKWTDIYFHCTVCENYNLCLNCFMKNIGMKHALKNITSSL